MTLAASSSLVLSEAERLSYEEEGYLVLPASFSSAEVSACCAALTRLCRGECGPFQGLKPNLEGRSDVEVLRQYLVIHFPHKLSPEIEALITHPIIRSVLSNLIGPNVKCVQSMFFLRPAGGPGQAWHQDEHYVPTRDRSLTGAWIALDEATVDSGCLWVIPGSHRSGVLWPHEAHDDPRFDPVGAACFDSALAARAVPLEVTPGSLILFNGYLLHRSLNNSRTSGFRRALAFHACRAESLVPWMGAERRGPIGGADCRDFVMVCGTDPYAFKPREELCFPWARPPRIAEQG